MKTIVVLIDPSHSSAPVGDYCLLLASKLRANILLFSTYLLLPETAIYSGAPWIDQGTSIWKADTKEKLQKTATKLTSNYNKLYPDGFKLTIHIQLAEGNVGTCVADLIKNKKIELVMMGAKSGSTIDHILLGSDTRSVINHSLRPILIIPQDISLRKMDRITFASNFDLNEIKGITYLVKLARLFDFHMEIIHVREIGEKDQLQPDQVKSFMDQVENLKYPKINHQFIRGKEIVPRLNRFCKETSSDMLALVHYQSNFLKRLLTKSTTKTALSNQKIPLLVYPSKME
ncbi:nucleotide-binding universal stress UspA family protein [Pedobacter sp. CG_S7]|uniref:universal stress protein n=1 Tax=Pedobacter sp. CG_S7 TaxID=3143930 RepID=UPI003392679C